MLQAVLIVGVFASEFA